MFLLVAESRRLTTLPPDVAPCTWAVSLVIAGGGTHETRSLDRRRQRVAIVAGGRPELPRPDESSQWRDFGPLASIGTGDHPVTHVWRPSSEQLAPWSTMRSPTICKDTEQRARRRAEMSCS
jgi:hypothetical protein